MRLVFLLFTVSLYLLISACSPSRDSVPRNDSQWGSTVPVEQNSFQDITVSQNHDPNPLPGDFPWMSVATPATIKFSQDYADFLILPVSVRENKRHLAESEMAPYHLLMTEVALWERYQDFLIRPHLYSHMSKPRYSQIRIGFNNSLNALEQATTLDLSYRKAWAAKGALALQVGALYQARNSLEAALLVTEEQIAAGGTIPLADHLDIHRNLGWTLRDLGHSRDGLIQIERALKLKPGDYELLLIKGLLLAGAGRTTEALKLAVALPVENLDTVSAMMEDITLDRTGYASLWIKSQALFAVGDYEGAMSVLGSRENHMRHLKHPLAFGQRYWTDVGLVAEMVGNEDAELYFRESGNQLGALRAFCLVMFEPGWHLILDYPDLSLPILTTFDSRFYVGGSFLGFISIQMNLLDSGGSSRQQEDAANRCLNALDVAERRHVYPILCRALRGRVFHKQGRYAEAKVELEKAHTQLAARGDIDDFTSYLLGLLALNDYCDAEAQIFLEEAVNQGSGNASFYRSLGLAFARQGKLVEAEVQLSKALEIDPHTVPGLFNMGLLYCKMDRYADAVRVLEQAYALDNENQDVQRLLHQAASSSRAQAETVH